MNEVLSEALSDTKLAFSLFKESINLFKTIRDVLPDSDEKNIATKVLDEAENKAKIAEASLAKSLGFLLCPKCWPPVVLTAINVSRNCDKYECISCNTKYLNHGKRNNSIRLEEIKS